MTASETDLLEALVSTIFIFFFFVLFVLFIFFVFFILLYSLVKVGGRRKKELKQGRPTSLFWTNRNNIAVTSIFLSISLSEMNH